MKRHLFFTLAFSALTIAQTNESAADLAARYLPELIRLDTTNPPGNETRVARYLKQVADREGIPAELLGDDPQRLNFVARLRGTGKQRPLREGNGFLGGSGDFTRNAYLSVFNCPSVAKG